MRRDRPTARRHDHDAPGRGAALWMTSVDQLPVAGSIPPHRLRPSVEHQRPTDDVAHAAPHTRSLVTTRPATAERCTPRSSRRRPAHRCWPGHTRPTSPSRSWPAAASVAASGRCSCMCRRAARRRPPAGAPPSRSSPRQDVTAVETSTRRRVDARSPSMVAYRSSSATTRAAFPARRPRGVSARGSALVSASRAARSSAIRSAQLAPARDPARGPRRASAPPAWNRRRGTSPPIRTKPRPRTLPSGDPLSDPAGGRRLPPPAPGPPPEDDPEDRVERVRRNAGAPGRRGRGAGPAWRGALRSDAARHPARGRYRRGDIDEVAVAFVRAPRTRCRTRWRSTLPTPPARRSAGRASASWYGAQVKVGRHRATDTVHQQPSAVDLRDRRATAQGEGGPPRRRSASSAPRRAPRRRRGADEVERRLPVIEARVDMRPRDRDQALGAEHLGRAEHQAHRRSAAPSPWTRPACTVGSLERQGSA